MMNIAAELLSTFWPYIAGAVAFIVGALGLYAKGRSDAKAKAREQRKDEALKTHERIDDARIEKDPDAAREWLAAHGRKLRDERKP